MACAYAQGYACSQGACIAPADAAFKAVMAVHMRTRGTLSDTSVPLMRGMITLRGALNARVWMLARLMPTTEGRASSSKCWCRLLSRREMTPGQTAAVGDAAQCSLYTRTQLRRAGASYIADGLIHCQDAASILGRKPLRAPRRSLEAVAPAEAHDEEDDKDDDDHQPCSTTSTLAS